MDKFINGYVGEHERRIQSCSVVLVPSNSFTLLSNIAIELLWSRRGEVGSQGNVILLRTHVSTFNISLTSWLRVYFDLSVTSLSFQFQRAFGRLKYQGSSVKYGKTKRAWHPSHLKESCPTNFKCSNSLINPMKPSAPRIPVSVRFVSIFCLKWRKTYPAQEI